MAEPYYQDDSMTLYHGNAFEILPTLDVTAHMAIVDPPYGVAFQSSRRQQKLDVIAGDDGSFDLPRLLTLTCRTLAPNRHLYIFRGKGQAVEFGASPLSEPAELVWDKARMGSGDLTAPWGPAHELISFTTYVPSRAGRKRGDGRLAARVRRRSVLRYPRPTAGASGRHPNEKPVGLMRELIESSSCIGETVLDPCCGIGATLVAARLEGRRAVGVEIDERYCEATAKRLEKAVPVNPEEEQ